MTNLTNAPDDVRSAVDDIEREVKAETDDLKTVREFADLGADLKAAQKDAEDIGREADSVLRDRPAVSPNAATPQTAEEAKRSLRPSQRSTTRATSNGGAESVPPIEQAAQLAEPASEPAAKATEAPAPATSNFDPFSKKPAKKGPVLIPRESATTEGDERTP